ncbi:MAG: DEAD/DEAH box helicase family protein, partial [Candidatus Andersenbacteria bacterium]
LLGVTGSGKTFTMASVIESLQKPALIITHNKTLAAQLAEEYKEFFPNNAVSYFVSYYDYYQPEAYIPRTDTYIAKDSSINDEIDRLRHAAMESILDRPDVIVVASVSCIYGLGRPEDYLEARVLIQKNQPLRRQELLRLLTKIQYERNDVELSRGRFRVRGDTVDIHPAGVDVVIRIEFFGPRVERVTELDNINGHVLAEVDSAAIFPATFFTTTEDKKRAAVESIRTELAERINQFKRQGKELEAQRIEQRTTYDLEMLEQLGYVSGIENYSRHFDGRKEGEPPATLLDYFLFRYGQKGFLTFIDESHMTIPQIGAMHGGDAARKKNLIVHGWRLPSAKDNRPLQ